MASRRDDEFSVEVTDSHIIATKYPNLNVRRVRLEPKCN